MVLKKCILIQAKSFTTTTAKCSAKTAIANLCAFCLFMLRFFFYLFNFSFLCRVATLFFICCIMWDKTAHKDNNPLLLSVWEQRKYVMGSEVRRMLWSQGFGFLYSELDFIWFVDWINSTAVSTENQLKSPSKLREPIETPGIR